jgi:hypothetical protein
MIHGHAQRGRELSKHQINSMQIQNNVSNRAKLDFSNLATAEFDWT